MKIKNERVPTLSREYTLSTSLFWQCVYLHHISRKHQAKLPEALNIRFATKPSGISARPAKNFLATNE
jgi:hypothetical protein